MDDDGSQLLSLEKQYTEVEKEAQNLSEVLKNSRKRRRQLEAEVRFLQKKVKFFTKKSNKDDQARPLNLGGRQGASRDQRPASKMEDAPQYFEVEVKFVDLKAMGNGFMDPNRIRYSPSPHNM